MSFVTIAITGVLAINPVQEMYKLNRYEEIIVSVNDQSTIEEKTFKSFALFHLNRFEECYSYTDKLVSENKSDSLKYIYAVSAYETSRDKEFKLIESSINSASLRDKLNFDYPDFEKTLESNLFLAGNNYGFTFVDGVILKADGNKLYLGDKVVLTWKGKYIAYPFVRGNQIVFAANEFAGNSMDAKGLDQISRQKISKLQLFIGIFKDGAVSDVKKLPFCSIEYDYTTPFIAENGDLYFSSNATGGFGGYDVYRAEKSVNGFNSPENLGNKVNSTGNEASYFETSDRAYLSSDNKSIGKMDVKVALRNSKLYSTWYNLGPGVNGRTSDFNFVSVGNTGYFNSTTIHGNNEIKIITDLSMGTEIKKSAISVIDNSGVVVQSYKVDYGNGIESTTNLNDSSFNVKMDKLFPGNYSFKAYGYNPLVKSSAELNENKPLSFKPNFDGVVEDYITGEPIEGVAVYAIKNGDTITHYTDKSGKWWHAIEENDGWEIQFGKSGYKGRTYSGDKVSASSLKNVAIGIDTKKGTKLEIRNIYFAFGKADLESSSFEVLDRLVSYLKENPAMKIELSAHTDSRGSDPANMTLSQKRATSAYNYLLSKGVEKSRLVPKGYGETKPVNKCTNGAKCSEEEFQLNRRVEIVIL